MGLCAVSQVAFAEQLPPGTHARTFVSAQDGASQPYNLFLPAAHEGTGSPLPLVVALHGHGATWESWFAATTVREWAEERGWIVLCPQGRGNFFYLGSGERDVFEAIEDARTVARIDSDRIFLIGHSMGGWGTWHTAAAHPDFFAGIAPMAGWAPVELVGNLEFLDPLVIHGDADEAVPVRFGRRAVAALADAGISHRYLELPGVGHESSMISRMLPAIGEHFAGRTRIQRPDHIVHRAFTPTRGKAWWASIRAVEEPGRLASIDLRLAKEGELAIKAENVSELILDPLEHPGLLAEGGVLRAPHLKKRSMAVVVVPDPKTHVVRLVVANGEYEWSAVERAKVPPVASPIVGKVITPWKEIAPRLAKLIEERTGADVGLFPTNFILPAPLSGDVALDQLLDLYPRPEDGVALRTMSKAELDFVLSKESNLFPAWWGPVVASREAVFADPSKRIPVAMTTQMAEQLDARRAGGEPLDSDPGQPGLKMMIIDQAGRGGGL